MNRFKILSLMLVCVVGLAATKDNDSIIGIWRMIKSESNDPKYKNPTGQLELQFADNGVLTVKLLDPANGVTNPQTMEGKFTLISPNRVSMTFDGSTQERYRYVFKIGEVQMEHLDFPVTNTLKRLTKFSM